MKLSLSQSPELRQNMQQKLEQKTELKAQLKQELAQTLKLEISGFQSELVGPPEALLSDVVSAVVRDIEQKEVRESVRHLIENGTLVQAMIKSPEDLAFADAKRLADFIIRYFYDAHEGKFTYETGEEGDTETVQIEFSKESWVKVNTDPQGAEKEAGVLEGMVKDTSKTNEQVMGAQMGLRELRGALEVASMSDEHLQALNSLLGFMFVQKGPDGQSILKRFFKEYVVLDKMNVAISERIQNRFAANFSGISKRTSAQMQNAFLNTLAEFSLVSMGIISKEIFTVQRADVDPAAVEFLEREAKAAGGDIRQALARYGLKSEGTIFWSRWHTLSQIPSADVDNFIRDFITNTFREEQAGILAAAHFEDFYYQLQVALEQAKDPDAKSGTLMAMITDKLMDTELRNHLLALMRDKWLPMLKDQPV